MLIYVVVVTSWYILCWLLSRYTYTQIVIQKWTACAVDVIEIFPRCFLPINHTSRNKTKIHFSVTIFVCWHVSKFFSELLCLYVTMSSFCSHLTSCNRRKSHLSVTPIWNFIVGIFPNSSPHCTNFLMNLQHFGSRPKHQEPKLKTPAISLRWSVVPWTL